MSLRPNTFNGHVEGAKSGLPIEHQVDVNGLQVHGPRSDSQSVSFVAVPRAHSTVSKDGSAPLGQHKY